ncbi:MAG TPA: hypothetical protein VMB81_17030 [Candidatus Sulfotelmatobacter sp.]|nr:hypothetical protein [Candidatus Sulfotelmatobacter sp.]
MIRALFRRRRVDYPDPAVFTVGTPMTGTVDEAQEDPCGDEVDLGI